MIIQQYLNIFLMSRMNKNFIKFLNLGTFLTGWLPERSQKRLGKPQASGEASGAAPEAGDRRRPAAAALGRPQIRKGRPYIFSPQNDRLPAGSSLYGRPAGPDLRP
jgi:hypothetical protein